MNKRYMLFAAPILAGLVLVGCGGDDDDSSTDNLAGQESSANENASDTGNGDAAGDQGNGPESVSPEVFDTSKATTSETGLMYIDEVVGDGTQPEVSNSVVVHYRGTLTDGTEFDSSFGGQPAMFPLANVIPGFAEGILGMQEGGKRTIYIPSALGYGPVANGPIPANSDLVFEIELLEVR